MNPGAPTDTYTDTMLWIADRRRSWNRKPKERRNVARYRLKGFTEGIIPSAATLDIQIACDETENL